MKKHTTPIVSMFRIQMIILVIVLLASSCAEESFSPQLTEEFTLQSTTNSGSYKIKVALPDLYDSSRSYATLYVLDGEENFDFVANRCSEISDALAVENVIVVSIGYGQDRAIDYTPTQVDPNSGGALQFLAFIRQQLIPEMEVRYNADTTRNGRAILGHSYGGLFAACAFAASNEVFGNYLLLSPSLWYDNEIANRLEKMNREVNNSRQQLVFMGIGEMENLGRMQAPFEAFYQSLSKNYSNMKITKNNERNLGHMGSRNPNIELGLQYYFKHRFAN